MAEIPLKNQIIEWLKNQYYWLQYSGNEVLEGAEINEALIETAYKYFKEDFELTELTDERITVAFNEVAVVSGVASRLKLLSINSIENVNALVTGQEIAINENLTLIYGENGSGKSGYIRLLNNAFSSIIEGDAKVKHEREFDFRKNTPIYAYIICDLTKKLKSFAKDAGYKLLPSGDGYFSFNDNYNMYIEIMSFDKVLKDSKERNRVLFEKLNLT